jgi:hypothetical protein
VEREEVLSSYSRYGYDVYHPQFESSVEAIHPAETELYSCRYLPILLGLLPGDLIVVHAETPNNFRRFFAQIPRV